jgi:hypothetical protein
VDDERFLSPSARRALAATRRGNHLHAVVLETPCFFAQADNFVRDPDINP